MKSKYGKPDTLFFLLLAILLALGTIMIFSTSPTMGISNFNDSYFFIKRHIVFLIGGIIIMGIGINIPHEKYKKIAWPGLIISTLILLLTLVPGLGVRINGASRWLNLGFIRIQPVELTKFFIIVYAAMFLENKGKKVESFRSGMLPLFTVLAVPVLILAKQPDFGNIILSMGTVIVLLFLSGTKIIHFILLMCTAVALGVLNILLHPYQMQRIETFLSPWEDPLGQSYHVIQSFIAIGSGGFCGVGLGQSKLKFTYLPLHYADFIFSIVCEEGGFLLATAVLILFAAFFYRGFTIAMKSSSPFSFYLANGLTMLLVIQGMINVGSVIGVLPVTGIPLTFISFGGTALVTSLFYAGVILNISRKKKNEPPDKT
jgi:cell division protein FtsW